MKCNTKTMLAIALALVFAAIVVYWALPQLRGSLSALAVVASALICPLSMLFMMQGMQSRTGEENHKSLETEERKSQTSR